MNRNIVNETAKVEGIVLDWQYVEFVAGVYATNKFGVYDKETEFVIKPKATVFVDDSVQILLELINEAKRKYPGKRDLHH